MAVSNSFKPSLNILPVVITTSATDASAVLPFATWWKLGVSGTPANISYQGKLATVVSGVGTSALTFTALSTTAAIPGKRFLINLLGNAGTVPLSISIVPPPPVDNNYPGAGVTVINVQLATSAGTVTSTANQVAALWQSGAAPAPNQYFTIVSGGAGVVVAAANIQPLLPAATSADPLYPIGLEDTPSWRSGEIHALGTATGGQVFFQAYEPG
jgi:hypothetical protein